MQEDLERSGADPTEIAWRGIELCRDGDWKEGLYWLGLAAGAKTERTSMPSLFYSYLGYGIARYQNRRQEGLRLCQYAVELEFFQPEGYYFLARTSLLINDRRGAVDAMERGLQVDANYAGLLELRRELGLRRRPVLPFLSRRNVLNRLFGRLRHVLLGRSSTKRAT